ncbi:LysM peptidoglycan-binding domain-containing protein [Candidatus Microgenomates bacterium]|nr:LysM peptidoglycan-binding domain-containing protein [Candidatus Microgenomates bacterium]
MWKDIAKKFNNPESMISLILGVVVILVVGATLINLAKNKTTSTSPQPEATTDVPGVPVGEKVTEQTTMSADFPKKYIVKEGDTLWNIALVSYSSGYNWVDIAATNTLSNPDNLTVGMELILPKTKPIYPEGSINGVAATATKEENYTVKQGDNLWQIACQSYTNCYRYTDIVKANGLSNPNQIEIGQVLKIPR